MSTERTQATSIGRLITGRQVGVLASAVVAVCGSLMASSSAQAAITRTWDGGAGTNAWTDANNWSDNNIPDNDPASVAEHGSEDARINNSASAVSVAFAIGATTAIGTLTIDNGDALSLSLSGGTRSFSVAGLSNAGSLTAAPGISTANGGDLDVNIGGTGQVFNTATGSMLFQYTGGRNQNDVNLTVAADNLNEGLITFLMGSSTRNTASLRLSGGGTFTNNGTIQAHYTATAQGSGSSPFAGSYVRLTSSGQYTFGGTGSLSLSMGTVATNADSHYEAAITGTRTGAGTTANPFVDTTLTNGVSHAITGAGFIGSNLNLINGGLIAATSNVAGQPIFVDPVATITNGSTGRLVSAGAAGLTIGTAGDTLTNNGLLESRSGSTLTIGAGTTVINGEVRGDGVISAATFTITGAGTLAPGDSSAAAGNAAETGNNLGKGASTVGLLDFTGNLVLNTATELNFQLGADDSAGTTYDSVNVGDALTLAGELNINALAGFDTGTYRLFTYDTNFELAGPGLTLGDVPAGYTYSFDTSTAGQVNLVVVPEPASFALAAVGIAGGLARRRRSVSR